MSENKNRQSIRRQHKVASIPYIGAIISIFVGYIIVGIIALILGKSVFRSINVEYLDEIAAAIIVLILFRLWFRPEYKGSFYGKGIKLTLFIPFLVVLGIDILVGIFWGELSVVNLTINTVTMSVTAGLLEETVFRVIPISLMLRNRNSGDNLVKIVIIPAAVFGLLHLSNMMSGAALDVSIMQVCSSFFAGLLFGALYVRTGSVLLPMILHGMHDFICFLDLSVVNEQGIIISEMTARTLISEGVMAALNLVMAIVILRKSVRDDVVARWKEIWSA